jgi:hypothetical protein
VISLPEFYEPKFVMRCGDKKTPRIVDLWSFKSLKSNKRYIVEVEGFDHEFLGLKFYWKGVEKSKNRYSLLTNDYEPRKIVRSCIEIMMIYYNKNKFISFGYVAAPDLEKDIKGKKIDKKSGSRRFKFYQRMMINLFGPETFYQASDTTNTIYLMINRKQLNRGEITIKDIERKINETYLGEFTIQE